MNELGSDFSCFVKFGNSGSRGNLVQCVADELMFILCYLRFSINAMSFYSLNWHDSG